MELPASNDRPSRKNLTLEIARMARGWSQLQLARRAGLRADQLNRIVNGRVVPNSREMSSIATALNVSAAAVFPSGNTHVSAGESGL